MDAALDLAGEGYVVDQSGADAVDAADAVERGAAEEHGSAGSGGLGTAGIGYPGEGIEHLEDEDEGGDKGSFGEGFDAEGHHLRDEIEGVVLGPCRRGRRGAAGRGRCQHR